MKQKLLLVLGAAAVCGGLLGAHPTKAAVATNYQLPCFSYGSPNYYFGQYISGGWGYHVGEDVCHTQGTPVFAPANGTVVYSARTPDSYRWGNLVMIEHQNADGTRVVSVFGHLSDNRQVAAGQAVSRGQALGFVGPQGAQNGNWEPHTHFGLHNGGYGAAVGTYASWVHGYEQSFPAGWLQGQAYINPRRPANEYFGGSVEGSPVMNQSGQTTITFRAWNIGTQAWYRDGGGSNNPTRLGTIGPLDRASGFSNNGAAAGWAGANRIKLVSDTAPGELATFTATFKSFGQPGTYPECFGMLQEGIGWLPVNPICVNLTILPPQHRAEWVTQMITTHSDPADLSGQTNADFLRAGDKRNLKAMVKNVGELPWNVGSGPNPVRLGTARPLDRPDGFATGGDTSIPVSENWPSYNRPSTIDGKYNATNNTVDTSATVINPGETAEFSFTITAPDLPGSYQVFYQPLVEGQTWMNDLGMWFPLRVLDRGYHYGYVTQTYPTAYDTTKSVQQVTLQLRNTGQVAWPVGGNLKLGTAEPFDNASPFYTASGTGAWQSPNRISSITRNASSNGKSTVDPGETAEFSFGITAPPVTPGNYQLWVRPVMEGVAWLPENYGIWYPVNITAPPYNHQVVAQNFSANPATLHRGDAETVKLAVKNNGRAAWPTSGANAVRLGTARPNDRISAFAQFGGSSPWLSGSRAAGISGKVTNLNNMTTVAADQISPGETALFQVSLDTNVTPGAYSEYFNLVAEGVTWFPDYGIYFPLNVSVP